MFLTVTHSICSSFSQNDNFWPFWVKIIVILWYCSSWQQLPISSQLEINHVIHKPTVSSKLEQMEWALEMNIESETWFSCIEILLNKWWLISVTSDQKIVITWDLPHFRTKHFFVQFFVNYVSWTGINGNF
jgi:hypothetical protein